MEYFKFHQRYKNFKNWFEDFDYYNKRFEEDILNKSDVYSKIYIFGHSLDPTDGDILKPFTDYLVNDSKIRFEKT